MKTAFIYLFFFFWKTFETVSGRMIKKYIYGIFLIDNQKNKNLGGSPALPATAVT